VSRDGNGGARAAVDAVWREHAGSMLGVLAKRLGDLDRAEEALQEALQEAVAQTLVHWADGAPPRPAGWLVTTAWHKAVDGLRRDATGRTRRSHVEYPGPTEDDRLALVFACCHPVLPQAAQVALTLHAASGLSTEEIAAAFLLPVSTMAQRLVRAKRRLREAGVRFAVPEPDEYPARLAAVLAVVYLVFNEGSLANAIPQRRELAREGLELARQLGRGTRGRGDRGAAAGAGDGHQPGRAQPAAPPPRLTRMVRRASFSTPSCFSVVSSARRVGLPAGIANR
jgi:predicted RNA polymerase sigma factor